MGNNFCCLQRWQWTGELLDWENQTFIANTQWATLLGNKFSRLGWGISNLMATTQCIWPCRWRRGLVDVQGEHQNREGRGFKFLDEHGVFYSLQSYWDFHDVTTVSGVYTEVLKVKLRRVDWLIVCLNNQDKWVKNLSAGISANLRLQERIEFWDKVRKLPKKPGLDNWPSNTFIQRRFPRRELRDHEDLCTSCWSVVWLPEEETTNTGWKKIWNINLKFTQKPDHTRFA